MRKDNIVIQFIGSDAGYQTFKSAMLGAIKVVTSSVDVHAAVYEISSPAALNSAPKSFKIPSFFYVTTKDPHVHGRIKDYPVNGIIFPPVHPDSIKSRLSKISGAMPLHNPAAYEMIKIKIIASAENIPPLPALAQQLINLTRSDSSTITDVTNKIKKDQGIASRVIKLINSPFYGMRREITSIDRATALLGFNSVKNIAMALSLGAFYKQPFNMYKISGNAFWAHSYKTACVSQFIAKELGLDEDAAYLAGLLHDVGKILMAKFLVKEVSSIEEEREQLGMNHAEAGVLILRKWSIASNIIDAVKEHHSFQVTQMGRVIFYANKIDYEHETAEETIEEMALTLGIKNIDSFKNRIIPFVTEFNADV